VKVSTAPYRTPSPELVTAGAWTILDGPPGDLSTSIEGWDYATTLRIGRRVEIDVAEILAAVALPPSTRLLLHVRARSGASLIRTSIARIGLDPDAGPVDLVAEIAGRELAGSVTVETLLELADDVSGGRPFSPSRAGSILWRDELSVVLEGDSGLLPIAPVSFADAGLPAGAAWYLSLDAGRWDWTAMGSVLVLLNTDNRAVATALANPATDQASVLFDTIEVDFVADLVGRAVTDEAFVDQFVQVVDDDLSVGALVRALIRTRLAEPTESVDAAVSRLKELRDRDPSRYRAVIQNGLSYPRSGNP
jgi:hypothetical protein